MKFTKKQQKVYTKIHKFLDSKKHRNLILLGPSGSGKTTIVTRSIFDYCDKETITSVYFCAFTNKATKVLKNMISKLLEGSNMCNFATIHTLLQLKPNTTRAEDVKYNKKRMATVQKKLQTKIFDYENLKTLLRNSEEQSSDGMGDDILSFDFDYKKLSEFYKINIIVIDECSTISRELYVYIESIVRWIFCSTGHSIKIIYLGDYYQLPPVGEDKSIIFECGKDWPLYKLDRVMRSKTDLMAFISESYLHFINKYIRTGKLTKRIMGTPYNIIKDCEAYVRNYNSFLNNYAQSDEVDKIMITYTKANSMKLNKAVQNIIDSQNNIRRDPDIEHTSFHHIPATLSLLKGDRIVLDKPIIVPMYKIIDDVHVISIGGSGTDKLYSGDIFIIEEITSVSISTCLNRFEGVSNLFLGNKIKIRPLFSDDTYVIFNINNLEAEKARLTIRKQAAWYDYVDTMQLFRNSFTTIKRGHCITCFKSQGSEYKHVYVNLKSFWYSLLSNRISKPMQLFSAFYTATTRASEKIYMYY